MPDAVDVATGVVARIQAISFGGLSFSNGNNRVDGLEQAAPKSFANGAKTKSCATKTTLTGTLLLLRCAHAC
jgi:hypothetical protein